MAKKKYSKEEIQNILTKVGAETEKGLSIKAACEKIDVSEQLYYKWKREDKGIVIGKDKEVQELREQNQKLKEIIVNNLDLLLEKKTTTGDKRP